MSKVDQFESVFRSAVKDTYKYSPVEYSSILVVTDLEKEDAESLTTGIKEYCAALHIDGGVHWKTLAAGDFSGTDELLGLVEAGDFDLIVSYRNLFSNAWRYPHSLGEYLDVLTQRAAAPVMVLPHPRAGSALSHAMIDTNVVMVITNHLANNHALIDYAVSFTEEKGTLWLAHIEDAAVFERYIEVISKIASIDTDEAREKIARQLLKEPREYIEAVREELREKALPITVEQIVTFGHRLDEYKRYIEEHKVDLLVMNARDDQQLAMHGLAYPLAVEIRNIPLLMV